MIVYFLLFKDNMDHVCTVVGDASIDLYYAAKLLDLSPSDDYISTGTYDTKTRKMQRTSPHKLNDIDIERAVMRELHRRQTRQTVAKILPFINGKKQKAY